MQGVPSLKVSTLYGGRRSVNLEVQGIQEIPQWAPLHLQRVRYQGGIIAGAPMPVTELPSPSSEPTGPCCKVNFVCGGKLQKAQDRGTHLHSAIQLIGLGLSKNDLAEAA